MDQGKRKLMLMHKALHPWDDDDRLYVSRKELGRGLVSSEYSVVASIKQLVVYTEKHEEGMITAIINDTNITIDKNDKNKETKIGEKNNSMVALND